MVWKQAKNVRNILRDQWIGVGGQESICINLRGVILENYNGSKAYPNDSSQWMTATNTYYVDRLYVLFVALFPDLRPRMFNNSRTDAESHVFYVEDDEAAAEKIVVSPLDPTSASEREKMLNR